MAELKSPYLPPTNYLLKMPHTHTHTYMYETLDSLDYKKRLKPKFKNVGKLKAFSDIIKTEKCIITDRTCKEGTSGRRQVIEKRESMVRKE